MPYPIRRSHRPHCRQTIGSFGDHMTDNRLLLTVDRCSSTTVHADGELDYVNCGEFGVLLQDLLSDGHEPISIHLRGLDFIDSSGFRVLLRFAHESRQLGKPVRIASMTSQISHLLKVSGCEDLFVIDVDEPTRSRQRPNAAPKTECSFSIPAKISACREARDAVCRFAGSVGAGQTACDDIRLAVGEAVSNAVRHGTDTTDAIDITCRTSDTNIIISISYPSEAFDPCDVPTPDIQDPCEGGMGIHFMRLVMDSVTYSFENGYATLTLVKRLGSPGD